MTPVPGPHLTPDDLDAWLDGSLAPGAGDHLSQCNACQERAETEREIVAMLGSLSLVSPRAGFADRVMARVVLPEPAAERTLAAIRRRVFATRRATALAAGLLLVVVASMAGSVVWTLGHRATLAALGGWLSAEAGQAAWYGVRGVASNLIEQPWFAALRELTARPGRLGLALGLALMAYASGVLALRRLLALPTQQVARVGA